MKSIISVVFAMFSVAFVSSVGMPMIESEGVRVPVVKTIKKSRGKGRGKVPYFAKFF